MTEFVGVLAGRIACPREVARVIGETMIEQLEVSERGIRRFLHRPRSSPRSVTPARGSARALIMPEITSIVRRLLPGRAAARGEDPLKQEGSPVQVPATVEPPAGWFTACVVRP